MSEYDYLRGNKQLFDRAPAQAMVVFEDFINGDIYFAESTQPGTRYWHVDGSPGLRTGLIGKRYAALSVSAERRPRITPVAKPEGTKPVPPRYDMIKGAANRKPLTPTPIEAKQKPVDEPPRLPVETMTYTKEPEVKKLVVDDGFLGVSQFEISDRINNRVMSDTPALRVSPKSYYIVRQCIAEVGERVDLQINPKTAKLRIRKVADGGAEIKKHQAIGCAKLSHACSFPDDKSFVVNLRLADDGWYYGEIPEANRARLDKVQRVA